MLSVFKIFPKNSTRVVTFVSYKHFSVCFNTSLVYLTTCQTCTKHMRLHIAEKRYNCKLCPRAFYTFHIKVHGVKAKKEIYLRVCSLENILPQDLHEYFISCTFICLYKLSACINFLVHTSHGYTTFSIISFFTFTP
jgi:hypothetical protein